MQQKNFVSCLRKFKGTQYLKDFVCSGILGDDLLEKLVKMSIT